MSLLTSVGSGSRGCKYYIENIGEEGDQPLAAVPCIKAGAAFGAIRVADPAAGLVLVGGGIGGTPLVSGLRGGGAAGTTVNLGSSTASQTNIVLTDGAVAVNGDLTLSGATSDLNVGGDIVLTNGDALGKSISGYYNAVIASASYADGADTPLATPGDLTPGWHIYAIQAAPGSQAEQSVSTLVYYNGTLFSVGGTIMSVAGAGSFGFKVSDDRTAMRLHNASGAAQTVTVGIAKLLN
jgi:hypothetical protein